MYSATIRSQDTVTVVKTLINAPVSLGGGSIPSVVAPVNQAVKNGSLHLLDLRQERRTGVLLITYPPLEAYS